MSNQENTSLPPIRAAISDQASRFEEGGFVLHEDFFTPFITPSGEVEIEVALCKSPLLSNRVCMFLPPIRAAISDQASRFEEGGFVLHEDFFTPFITPSGEVEIEVALCKSPLLSNRVCMFLPPITATILEHPDLRKVV